MYLQVEQHAILDVNRMLRLAEHSYHCQLNLSAYVVEQYMLQICICTVRDGQIYLAIHEVSSFCPPDHETIRVSSELHPPIIVILIETRA